MTRLRMLVVALVAGALGVALWAFEPWRAFTSSEVDEAVPTSAEPTASSTPRPRPHGESTGDAEPSAGQQAKPAGKAGRSPAGQPSAATTKEPRDRVLSRTSFEDAEYATTGRAAVLRLADGRRFVRLEDLDTSDGPDLHVWLSGAPSGGEWGSYDDGRYVRLGPLKATSGNQNYEVPASADLRGLRSVVIWCDRFNVAFGSAPLATS